MSTQQTMGLGRHIEKLYVALEARVAALDNKMVKAQAELNLWKKECERLIKALELYENSTAFTYTSYGEGLFFDAERSITIARSAVDEHKQFLKER